MEAPEELQRLERQLWLNLQALRYKVHKSYERADVVLYCSGEARVELIEYLVDKTTATTQLCRKTSGCELGD